VDSLRKPWCPPQADSRGAGILGVLKKFLADRIAGIPIDQVMAKVLNQGERVDFEATCVGHGDVPQEVEKYGLPVFTRRRSIHAGEQAVLIAIDNLNL
jgi:hypothetical protein